jgi:thiamine-phosphate pyrophosphorylase
MTGELRAWLRSARVYMLSRPMDEARLEAAMRGGVDLLQLAHPRDASDEEIVSMGRRFKAIASRHGVPLLLNSRPDLVAACGADGVHLNADDGAVAQARSILGAEPLIGLWIRSEAQLDAAASLDLDYLSVGPIDVTPTLAGVPATSVDLAAQATRRSVVPVFAVGGIDATNIRHLVAAGVTRVAVLREIAEAADPRAAVTALAAALA